MSDSPPRNLARFRRSISSSASIRSETIARLVHEEIFPNKLQHAPYLEIVNLFRRGRTRPHASHADASFLGGSEAVLWKRGATSNLTLRKPSDHGLNSALFFPIFRW